MPKFKPRRGAAAIEKATANKGGGNRTGFVPEIFWKEDGEKKYVLFLADFDEESDNGAIALDLHEFIPVGKAEKANGDEYTKYETFVSRKDPVAGSEDYDDIEDRLGRKPKTRVLGVGVELEPRFETVRGRQRAKGFSVKTESFTRKTDDGEEEVLQPAIGVISQSWSLMWSPLQSYDESQGPLCELPLEVTKKGVKTDMTYTFVPFLDAPVDLDPLFDNLEGVGYLRDKLDDIKGMLADDRSIEDAKIVASVLLEKRIEELVDKERYDSLIGPIDELPPPPWEKGGNKAKAASSRPASRPARKSPREASDNPSKDNFEELKARISKSSA